MRCAAFDSKEFKRVPASWDGNRKDYGGGFFTPLGVGVVIDDSEEFAEKYFKTTQELTKSFSIANPRLLYSSSTLKNELEYSKATAFAQQLVDAVSEYVSLLHFSYVILPSKSVPEVTLGGNRCPEYKIKTEDFMRNLNPMFSYISAWNYKRYRWKDESKLLIDSFRSKETLAWKELIKYSNITIVPHGDEVNPLISFADIIAHMTDVKLYNSEIENRRLSLQSLKNIWNGTFEVESTYIDETYLNKVKWTNDKQIDLKPYLLKPTVFFISEEPKTDGINEGLIQVDSEKTTKKSERLTGWKPVREAMDFATLNGYAFQFFDPNTDHKNINDGDIIIYLGEKSKQLATFYEDGFDVNIYKAKEVRKLKKFA